MKPPGALLGTILFNKCGIFFRISYHCCDLGVLCLGFVKLSQLLYLTCGSVRIRPDPSGSVRRSHPDPSRIRFLKDRFKVFWLVVGRKIFFDMCVGVVYRCPTNALTRLQVFPWPLPLPRAPSVVLFSTKGWCTSFFPCTFRASIP